MEKKEFATTALDPEYEAFVVDVAALSTKSDDEMHLSKKVHIAHLKRNETPVEVSTKYAYFANVLFLKLVVKLPKHTRINDHIIELVKN